ncbi:HAD superfamily hydrolase, 5'-nucleotidase [Ancylostoma ceylanicum]|uniref:HAD superfamily hydrolase, 5'-nucleotidase n=1 Tax=Ancylostoma ceylanicum TaxID=53326 RepID=A0A0D6M071_9BILA|nr:HAD superfamily hydrolase, 5'-nucleotidase [Ancylostoma ceylanicum]
MSRANSPDARGNNFIIRSTDVDGRTIRQQKARWLTVYNSPICEQLAFDLALKRLIDIGYPKEIQICEYKREFVVRNAWFDKRLGNLLKTDEHCNILSAFRGFRKLQKKEIREYYPNKHIALEETRIFVLNTVFNVPETLLLATIVDYFEHQCGLDYSKLANGLGYKRKDKQQIVLFSTIFEDCRSTIDWIHTQGCFKELITANLSKYIARDDRAVAMFQKLSKEGKKLFLLTNSSWHYTDLHIQKMKRFQEAVKHLAVVFNG